MADYMPFLSTLDILHLILTEVFPYTITIFMSLWKSQRLKAWSFNWWTVYMYKRMEKSEFYHNKFYCFHLIKPNSNMTSFIGYMNNSKKYFLLYIISHMRISGSILGINLELFCVFIQDCGTCTSLNSP